MTAIAGSLAVTFNPAFEPRYKEVTKQALQKAALVWERNVKILITDEDHIITGRYRASINLNTRDGVDRDVSSQSQEGDGHHELSQDGFTLEVGTNVEYAIYLEAKYNILARGLSISEKEMREAFGKHFRSNL